MKRFILLPLFILSNISIFACSFSCYLCREFQDKDFVFGGEIVQTGNEYVQIKVLDYFRGNESREIITIWSGTDFDCNGWHSMSANEFGGVGDSIVIMTHLIETINNPWDVECDYFRSDFCYNSSKNGNNDWILGGFGEGWVSYEKFKEKWEAQELVGCENYETTAEFCEMVGNEEVEEELKEEINIIPNLTAGPFIVSMPIDLENELKVKIFDASGKMVIDKKVFQREHEFDLSQFSAGVYFVSIFKGKKILETKRVVKI